MNSILRGVPDSNLLLGNVHVRYWVDFPEMGNGAWESHVGVAHRESKSKSFGACEIIRLGYQYFSGIGWQKNFWRWKQRMLLVERRVFAIAEGKQTRGVAFFGPEEGMSQ